MVRGGDQDPDRGMMFSVIQNPDETYQVRKTYNSTPRTEMMTFRFV